MKHPRDIYLRACMKEGLREGEDYFAYNSINSPTHAGRIADTLLFLDKPASKAKEVKTLADFLSKRKSNKTLQIAYAHFLDYADRILLEAMLLYLPFEQVGMLHRMNQDVLKTYCTYFFNLDDIKDANDQMAFISLIVDQHALQWFRSCSTRNIDNFRYLLSGTVPEQESETTLKEIRYKAKQIFETYIDPPKTEAPFFTQKEMFLMNYALKAGAIAYRAAGTEIANSDALKSIKEFMKSWEVKVKQDDTEQFEMRGSPDMEDDLAAQYREVSPLSEVDDEILDENEDLYEDGE